MPYYPTSGGRVTSGYGPRKSPVAGASTNHLGLDFGGNIGDPVFAPVDLRISTINTNSRGFGNLLVGTDASGNQHYFGHVSGFDVNQGQQVTAGQQIARVGNEGNSSGPHLHYEIRGKDGIQINPEKFLQGALKKGSDKIKDGARNVIKSIPVYGDAIAGIADGIGLTAECGWLCQIKNWVSSTEIVQRTAYILIALIFIGGALYLFGSGQTRRTLQQAVT